MAQGHTLSYVGDSHRYKFMLSQLGFHISHNLCKIDGQSVISNLPSGYLTELGEEFA